MKRELVILMVLWQVLVFADRTTLDNIQEYCNEINDGVQGGTLLCMELNIDCFYPGTGEQTTKLKFYYSHEADESEQSMPPVLAKVLVEYGIASSIFYYIEYFYGENVELVFHYLHSTGYECGEKRFYFGDGKLLKLKVNPIDDEYCVKSALTKKYENYERTDDFRDEDMAEAGKVLKKAEAYKKTFTEAFAAERVEK